MKLACLCLFVTGMGMTLGAASSVATEGGAARVRETLRHWEQAGRYRWEATTETVMPAPLRFSHAVLLRGYTEIDGPTHATLLHTGSNVSAVFVSNRTAVNWGDGWKAPSPPPRGTKLLPHRLLQPPDPAVLLAGHWASLPAPDPLGAIRRLLDLLTLETGIDPEGQFVGELDGVGATACLGLGALGLFDLSSDPIGLPRAADRGRITWNVRGGRLDAIVVELEGVSLRGPDGRPAHPALVATKRVSLRLLEAGSVPAEIPQDAKVILGL